MMYHYEKKEPKPTVPNNTPWPQSLDTRDSLRLANTYLQERHLDAELAWENAWYVSCYAGDESLRIVIPCESLVPRHNYWQARLILAEDALRYHSAYGSRLDALVVVRPLRKSDVLCIVEGPMDALACAGCGVTGVAVMGTRPTTPQLNHLARLCQDMNTVLILPDRDDKVMPANVLCYLTLKKIRATMIQQSIGKDMASLTIEQRKDVLPPWTNGRNN